MAGKQKRKDRYSSTSTRKDSNTKTKRYAIWAQGGGMPSHPNISQPAHPEKDEATLGMSSDIWDERHILRRVALFCGEEAAAWLEGHTAPRELAPGEQDQGTPLKSASPRPGESRTWTEEAAFEQMLLNAEEEGWPQYDECEEAWSDDTDFTVDQREPVDLFYIISQLETGDQIVKSIGIDGVYLLAISPTMLINYSRNVLELWVEGAIAARWRDSPGPP